MAQIWILGLPYRVQQLGFAYLRAITVQLCFFSTERKSSTHCPRADRGGIGWSTLHFQEYSTRPNLVEWTSFRLACSFEIFHYLRSLSEKQLVCCRRLKLQSVPILTFTLISVTIFGKRIRTCWRHFRSTTKAERVPSFLGRSERAEDAKQPEGKKGIYFVTTFSHSDCSLHYLLRLHYSDFFVSVRCAGKAQFFVQRITRFTTGCFSQTKS